MAKSADAFRTISEVAEWLETPAHVLRFWESKFAQVKPVKRAGGRRYYRPTDMLLLGGIKKLLHTDGMTIKGVQKLLREQGVKHVAAHSQPLDDLTATDDKTVTIEPARDAVTPPPTQAAPVPGTDEDAGTPSREKEAVAEAPSNDEARDEAVDDEAPLTMPSFSHRPVATDAAQEPPAEPPAPKPKTVDVPDDPADDIAAEPGILSSIAALKQPISDDMADRLGRVLDRLRHGDGGNGQGQGS